MTMQSSAKRNYTLRIAALGGAYVATLLPVVFWFKHAPPSGALAYAAALAPALPVVGMVWTMGLYLTEETDEYIRVRRTRDFLWAMGLTLSICSIWGFLENFDLAPHFPLFYVFVLFCAALGVARCVSSLIGLMVRPA